MVYTRIMRVRGFFFRVLVAGVAITPVLVGAASRPAPRGTGGAVSSAEHDATMAGVEVLSAGGNAADAAVATALALAVVHPQAGNLGGGGFAVVRFAGEVTTLDFRETAPRAAHRDMYLGDDGSPVREASWIGPLAAGVPGSPVGLPRRAACRIHVKHHGRQGNP